VAGSLDVAASVVPLAATVATPVDLTVLLPFPPDPPDQGNWIQVSIPYSCPLRIPKTYVANIDDGALLAVGFGGPPGGHGGYPGGFDGAPPVPSGPPNPFTDYARSLRDQRSLHGPWDRQSRHDRQSHRQSHHDHRSRGHHLALAVALAVVAALAVPWAVEASLVAEASVAGSLDGATTSETIFTNFKSTTLPIISVKLRNGVARIIRRLESTSVPMCTPTLPDVPRALALLLSSLLMMRATPLRSLTVLGCNTEIRVNLPCTHTRQKSRNPSPRGV
jgi:hypothetical protein